MVLSLLHCFKVVGYEDCLRLKIDVPNLVFDLKWTSLLEKWMGGVNLRINIKKMCEIKRLNYLLMFVYYSRHDYGDLYDPLMT